ncbi:MAG TPA: dephospho-CoA kinase [Clostridiaceae bacterium]|nr:dephospho-CoA kinase [Clostridiaceae bacterium]
MVRIGLTGGIATGKTTIARHLTSLGIRVIDADEIAREVLDLYPEILEYLRSAYGDSVFEDGKLNRKALGRIIFQSEEDRKKYLKVIMPRIREEIGRRLKEDTAAFVVLDAPLLFEENFHKDVDVTITVYADENVQLQRLMARDGYTEDEARRRIRAQMDLQEKRKLSTYVINNSGKLENTMEDLVKILERLGFYDEKEEEIEEEKKNI